MAYGLWLMAYGYEDEKFIAATCSRGVDTRVVVRASCIVHSASFASRLWQLHWFLCERRVASCRVRYIVNWCAVAVWAPGCIVLIAFLFKMAF